MKSTARGSHNSGMSAKLPLVMEITNVQGQNPQCHLGSISASGGKRMAVLEQVSRRSSVLCTSLTSERLLTNNPADCMIVSRYVWNLARQSDYLTDET